MRAFHKQEIIKQKIYGKTLARKSEMDYIPGMHFEDSLTNID